jgi:hypothetical protein
MRVIDFWEGLFPDSNTEFEILSLLSSISVDGVASVDVLYVELFWGDELLAGRSGSID